MTEMGAKPTGLFARHEWRVSAGAAARIDDAECLELVETYRPFPGLHHGYAGYTLVSHGCGNGPRVRKSRSCGA